MGTFDPPHIGHHSLVRDAIDAFGLDAVYVYTDSIPNYKISRQPLHHRQEMVRRLFEDDPDIHTNSPPAAQPIAGEGHLWEIYAHIKSAFIDDDVYIIMGVDTFVWYRDIACVRRALPPVPLIVVRRAQSDEPIPDTLNGAPVLSFVQREQELSSTSLRQKLNDGIRPDEITPQVYAYIEEKGFYRQAVPGVSTIGDSRHWISREKTDDPKKIGNVGIEIVANPHLYSMLFVDLMQKINDSAVRPLRWIDLGAGTGKLSRDILLADPADVPGLWGIDKKTIDTVRHCTQQNTSYEKDSYMVDVAHQSLSTHTALHSMGAERCDVGSEFLPEKDASVDMAVSRTLLMHLNEKELAHHLQDVRRVLKKGSCYHVLIMSPVYQVQNVRWFGHTCVLQPHEKITFQHGETGALQGFTHYYRDLSTYYDMFTAAGFTIEDLVHPSPLTGWEETHGRYYRADTPLFVYLRLRA